MKHIALSSILAVILGLSCAGSEEGKESAKNCLPCADLTITNSSEYTIIELYAHTTPVYANSSDKILIAQNLATGDTLQFPIQYGDSYYFTFMRKYFSTSTIDIAITTEEPVIIENCYKYSLFLLEQEFYLEKIDNFTK